MFVEIPNSVPVKGQFPPFCVFSLRINSSSQVYRTPSPSQKKPIANSHISSFFFNLLCPPWIIPAFTFRVFFLVVILFPINIYMAYLNESAQTKTAWPIGCPKKLFCCILQCPLDHSCQMVNKYTKKKFQMYKPINKNLPALFSLTL